MHHDVEHTDSRGQCSIGSMLTHVANAAYVEHADARAWPVRHLDHADVRGQCNIWSMLIYVASAIPGAC